MNRDYVRSSKPQRKRKPAARATSRQPARAPFPLLRALLAVALVLGFALFLYFIKGTAEEPTAEQKAPPKAKPVPIEEQRPAKEKFDYMTLLENKDIDGCNDLVAGMVAGVVDIPLVDNDKQIFLSVLTLLKASINKFLAKINEIAALSEAEEKE